MSKRSPPKSSPEVQQLERRALQHEAEIRQRLESVGGIQGPTMQSLIQLFGNWRHSPQPEALHEAVQIIQDLGLLSLPEHRHGVAGALMAVAERCPDEIEYLRPKYDQLFRVIEKVAPHLPQGEVQRPEEVEYLWMYWMVTGTKSLLAKVASLTTKPGPTGVHAAGYLVAHSYLPEVVECLAVLDAQQSLVAGKPVPGHSAGQRPAPGGKLPVEEVHALVLEITKLPDGRQRAAQVGWVPALDSYVVWTRDGSPWPEIPGTWRGKPVTIRRASAEQLATHTQLLDAADEV